MLPNFKARVKIQPQIMVMVQGKYYNPYKNELNTNMDSNIRLKGVNKMPWSF